ncbi:MAG TPA: Gmad2 immunoglobulin-like domain-containing protein [Candidatus Dormibacteraeota bacterium]|nr:Gmad2 immunoglobulin-like domain-containing protein [Candidatus Dormibacteraeota bacterium]
MITRRFVACLLVAAAVLALVACTPPTAATPTPAASSATVRPSPTATPSPSPSPTATASPTPTPAPAGYTSPRGSITVDQPRAFAAVTSPMTVNGTATLFEGGFSWRLLDAGGKELAKGTGQASPGAPAKGTFSFNVTFSVTSDTYGYISLISFSAKDNSVDDEARVPIILAAR